MKDESICVLVVTYNRSRTLMKTLQGVMKQSKNVEGIFIFNNHGNDNTEEKLKKNGFVKKDEEILPNKLYSTSLEKTSIYYYYNDTNLGGAGGFAKGIKMVSELDYNYLWIMDDDVLPEPDCLEIIRKEMVRNDALVGIPNRTDDNFVDKACVDIDFSDYHKFWTEMRKSKIAGPFKKDSIIVNDMPFEGPVIDMQLVRKVGIPDSGFFIEYDDSDYAQRLQNYSNIVFATRACLHRQLAKKTNAMNKVKKPYNWRNYYKIRNNIVFDKRYGENYKVKYFSPLILILHHIYLSLKDHHLKANLPIILKAYYDGVMGKMGKRVDPDY